MEILKSRVRSKKSGDKSPHSKIGSVAVTNVSYAWYVAIVLMVCNTLSFIDRQLLGLLVTPIQRDLGVSDTQMGLLQGLAFGIFYTLLGIPMGRIVDRSNRRNLRYRRGPFAGAQ